MQLGELRSLIRGSHGSPVVYLHGFPDHPPSARPFLDALVARGHRVAAPWLRGYAPSPLAGPYDLDTLARDVLRAIDAWCPGEPVGLVGHDWGAAITYRACQLAPHRIRRAVTLALPHPLTFLARLRSATQLRHSWYMALFQLPGAGHLVGARDLALVDRLWRAWSPGFVLDDHRRAELHACLARSLPAPLGYYRAMFRSPRAILRAGLRIEVPVLQVHGAGDGCVLPPDDRDARRFARRELVVLPGLGHFLHLEAPAAIAARVSSWITETEPARPS